MAVTRKPKAISLDEYRSLVENLNDVILTLDLKGTITYISPVIERISSHQAEEMPGQRFIKYIHQDDHRIFLESTQQALQGKAALVEIRLLEKKEPYRHVRISMNAVMEKGEPSGFILRLTDINEQKLFEEELHKSEAQYRVLFNHIPDPVFIFDRETYHFLDFNHSALRIYGFTPEEFRQMTPFDLHPPEEKEIVEKTINLHNFDYQLFYNHITKEGRRFDVAIQSRESEYKNKPVWISIIRDVSGVKAAERQQMIFTALGKRLSAAVNIEDAANVVLLSAQELFGWDACTFDTYDRERDLIFPVINIDTIDGKRTTVSPTLIGAPPSLRMRKTIAEGAQLFLRHTENDSNFPAIPFGDVKRASESVMSIPIKVGTKTVALMSAQSYTPHAYDGSTLELFEALADFCGGAMERIQAEEALRISQEKFRSLFEYVPNGVYQSTREGKLISVNKALVKMLGYDSVEDLLNVDIASDLYINPDERKQFLEHIEQYDSLRNTELHWRRKDGKPIVLLENSRVVRDKYGMIRCYEGTLTDITDLKEIEEALRDSEEKYRTLIEKMGEGVILLDANDRIIFVNEQFCKITGFIRDELVGNIASSFYQNEEQRKVFKEKKMLRIEGFSDTYEMQMQRKDGAWIWVSVCGSPVYDGSGNVSGAIGICTDITERKRTQLNLMRALSLYEATLDSTADGILVVNREGKIVSFNKRYAIMWQIPDSVLSLHEGSETLNFVLDQLIDPDGFVKKIQQLYEHPEEESFDVLEFKDGREFERLSLPQWLEGEVVGRVWSFRDVTQRRQAEKAMRGSEERFRKVFEEGPFGMAIVGIDFKFINVNEAICRMLEYPKEELLAQEILEITHPDDREKDLSLATKLIGGEIQSYNLEKRYITKKGEIFWGRLTVSLVREGSEKPLYGIAIVEDISERKRTEEMLRLFESAVMQAHESIIITTSEINLPGPQIVFANPAFTKMTGYRTDEVIGKTPRILQGEKTDRLVLDRLRDAISKGEDFGGEAINYRKDKSEFTLEWHVAPIKNEKGEITHFLGIQRDITERKHTEEVLRKSEKRYRQFFEEDLTGDFISTPEGILLECNPSFIQMFGFASRDEAMSYDVRNLFANVQLFEDFISIIKEKKKLEYYEMELLRPDGTIVYVIQNIIGIFNKNGQLLRIKGYLFDNTERKKLEEQLLHSQRMESIGTIAAGIAHNFNNIMSIIMGYASLLKMGNLSEEKVEQNANAIVKTVQRGAGLVRQLTTFARKTEAEMELISMNAMVEDVAKMVKATFPENFRCNLSLQENIPPVLADPNQIHQALLNLCVNARDAMPNGGDLHVKTFAVDGESLLHTFPEVQSGEYVCITVADTGMGFDKATREHIFEPFFTTKEIGKGTGLGLAVVYGVIKNHDGLIEVESEKDKGATFRLYFIAQPGMKLEGETTSGTRETAEGGAETVLVVEDEEMLLELVTGLLETRGYKTLVARDGIEAIEMYEKHGKEIAVVLTDMGLPRLGGFEAFQKLKEMNPNVKTIMASGYLDPGLKSQMIKAGASDFIQKPYEPEQMLKRIREVIDGSK